MAVEFPGKADYLLTWKGFWVIWKIDLKIFGLFKEAFGIILRGLRNILIDFKRNLEDLR